MIYLFDEDGTARLARNIGAPQDHSAAVPVVTADGGMWPTDRPAWGESAVVQLPHPDGGPPSGGWSTPPTRALAVPLLQRGHSPYGFLVAALNPLRELDDDYRTFLDLVAGHLSAAISGARGYRALQRRAEELAELDRAKTAFFSNVSHEFRTPLALIMGPLEDLRARLADDADVSRELDTVHRNALRLSRLVNALLDFTRIQAGRMRGRYEPVDLALLTSELASAFRSAVERAGLTFDVDCPRLDRPVYVDRQMWEQVVFNLLSNALKYTHDGAIRVTVHAEDADAVVTIADTGIGIPADEMPRLFERFHRIENADARSVEGTGIGLALTRELVGLHGGTIGAESAPDRGTSFTVRLRFGAEHLPHDALATATPGERSTAAAASPYLEEALRWLPPDATAAPRPAGPAVAPTTPPGAFPARVLLADDNADMREYLTRILTEAGYEVEAVADGRAALDAVRAAAPDLVVSDVMMPHLDGLQLAAALRGASATAALPVLLLSARAGQEASIEGLEAGADDYVVKPFTAADLLARVRANIELSRLRTHYERWRTALVESLNEGFYVCDERGAVVEINAAFTDILGFGPEGLPYRPIHPWWPDAAADPDAHRQVAEAFASLPTQQHGVYTLPLDHRDGHRLWVTTAFSRVRDPETGGPVIVGTFRDVTAEHLAIQRTTALGALSSRLSKATDLAGALAGALQELRTLWRADRVLAAVFDDDGTPALAATDGSCWDELDPAVRSTLAEVHRQPLLSTTGGPAGMGVPLEHPHGRMALWVDTGGRALLAADQLTLSILAGRLAQGLVRVHQIDQQRETAVTLQRAILGPSTLPDGFAVRYEPATRRLEVGGDWYDVVPLTDDTIGIVVGDCVGHGLEAATIMGQLRSACRALLIQDAASPARTLAALDRFATTMSRTMCATVFCGVLDTAAGHLVYSSAGHPPGILADPAGRTELLDGALGLPLSVRPDAPRPEASLTLPARATLLLYTDGLVERRRHSLNDGIDRVGRMLCAGGGSDVEALATAITVDMRPPGGYDDDVAVLLYRNPGPLDHTFPATPAQLAPVRHLLRAWLDRCAIPSDIGQDILLAAGEACANAIEHGHRADPGGPVRLRARATVDTVHLTVQDSGRWKTPTADDPHRGRGITLMRALMQQVTITPTGEGTTVEMAAHLGS